MKTRIQTFVVITYRDERNGRRIKVADRTPPTDVDGAVFYMFEDTVTVELEHAGESLTHSWGGLNSSKMFITEGWLVTVEDAIAQSVPCAEAWKEQGYAQIHGSKNTDGTVQWMPFDPKLHEMDIRTPAVG